MGERREAGKQAEDKSAGEERRERRVGGFGSAPWRSLIVFVEDRPTSSPPIYATPDADTPARE